MNFGEALHHLRNGVPMRRAGWNGEGMFVIYRLGSDVAPRAGLPNVLCQGYIEMLTADKTLVPWLCSQTDMLAVDWEPANDTYQELVGS